MYTDAYYAEIFNMFMDEYIKQTDTATLLTYIDRKYTDNNDTLLHICIQYFEKCECTIEILKNIIKYIDGKTQNKLSEDAFVTAVKYYNPEYTKDIIQTIIDYGVDIDHMFPGRSIGSNVLSYILMTKPKKQLEIVQLLINMGADVNKSLSNNNISLSYAILYKCSIDIMKLLISNGITDKNLKLSFIYAIRNQNLDAIKTIIDTGIDINDNTYYSPNYDGGAIYNACGRPIELAIFNNVNIEILKALIDAGAKINSKVLCNSNVTTNIASNIDYMKLLIDAGLDINTPNDKYCSLIGAVIYIGRYVSRCDINMILKTVKLLLDSGIDVNRCMYRKNNAGKNVYDLISTQTYSYSTVKNNKFKKDIINLIKSYEPPKYQKAITGDDKLPLYDNSTNYYPTKNNGKSNGKPNTKNGDSCSIM